MNISFVHLRVHSAYSFGVSIAPVASLALAAKAAGMPALALTDHHGLYGLPALVWACREHDLQPIIGCEVSLAVEVEWGMERPPHFARNWVIPRLILLAETPVGYRNLLQIVQQLRVPEGERRSQNPALRYAVLAKNATGLIVLSGSWDGLLPQAWLAGGEEGVRRVLRSLRRILSPQQLRIEVQDHGWPIQRKMNRDLLQLARQWALPVVATHTVCAVREEDQAARAAMVVHAARGGEAASWRFFNHDCALLSVQAMRQRFAELPAALAETVRIAERCSQATSSFCFSPSLPAAPLPVGREEHHHLRDLSYRGARIRYADPLPQEVQQRLEEELATVFSLGMTTYLLIVADVVRYAHRMGIACGPGRGSAAGSLLVYTLGITDVDPIQCDLLFARFLHAERKGFPDIDLDVDDRRRPELLSYLKTQYGEENVAQMVAFGSWTPRLALQALAPQCKVSKELLKQWLQWIPRTSTTLEVAFQSAPAFRRQLEEPVYTTLRTFLQHWVGLPRQVVTHPAGVIITSRSLVEQFPLEVGTHAMWRIQYDMHVLRKLGFLKLDILGLRHLAILDSIRSVQSHIPDGDAATYQLLARGDTVGLFQVESPGMRRLLRTIRPTRLDDLMDILALHRPGTQAYANRYLRFPKSQRPGSSVEGGGSPRCSRGSGSPPLYAWGADIPGTGYGYGP